MLFSIASHDQEMPFSAWETADPGGRQRGATGRWWPMVENLSFQSNFNTYEEENSTSRVKKVNGGLRV
ncbi:hypothetical protein BS78_10G097200 [Paspalum vaginatum]|nr:hypothetical protein BS78_10G097200 [Paspalum vaginatum]